MTSSYCPTALRFALGLSVALLPYRPVASGAEGASVATVTIRNLTQSALRRAPVTFGQVFRKGDVPARHRLTAPAARGRSVQVDVKRHHDDGSVRFAIVSVLYEQLDAGRTDTVELVPRPVGETSPRGGIGVEELLETGFDATVVLDFPDGTEVAASARALLEEPNGRSRTWLQGPVATEWILGGHPRDRGGRPDEDIEVAFHVRAYARSELVRVSVVVENCSDRWAGNIRYDARVDVGGKAVFSADRVDHRRLSRWRKVFWWGSPAPAVHLAHDLATLSDSGALPKYDRTVAPAELSEEARGYLDLDGPDYRILGKGSLVAYMPTTGGRMEIAPYPTWTVRYLLTMRPEARATVLAHGDLAGSWPIHVRARRTGRILTIDERPEFWLDSRGTDRPEWKPDRHEANPETVKLTPDLAHQPSLAFVPYLVTGDFYYLEEAYFWAGYSLLATWPSPRRDAMGILSGQIRGNAWALRNIADAAWIGCDDDPEVAYLEEKIRNNLRARTRKMYGPPEFNKIGAWGLRTVTDARIQNAANPRWMVTAPWEEDYLLWSLHHLTELGYLEAARPRDFLLRLRVGLFTHAPDFDPMLAAPYRLVVGERTRDDRIVVYEEWKKLGQENARLSKPELPNYGNSYAYSARAAVVCGIDADHPKARDALRWLDARLPNHRAVLAANPVWAIVPRSGE